jgi:hypothetical protein
MSRTIQQISINLGIRGFRLTAVRRISFWYVAPPTQHDTNLHGVQIELLSVCQEQVINKHTQLLRSNISQFVYFLKMPHSIWFKCDFLLSFCSHHQKVFCDPHETKIQCRLKIQLKRSLGLILSKTPYNLDLLDSELRCLKSNMRLRWASRVAINTWRTVVKSWRRSWILRKIGCECGRWMELANGGLWFDGLNLQVLLPEQVSCSDSSY